MATQLDTGITLPFGSKVRCRQVDMFGLQGRDPHPTPADVGFTGVIMENMVEHDDGTTDENVAPGTPLPEESTVYYTVIAPDGRKLVFAPWELELIALP
jgi:hypothetical protein